MSAQFNGWIRREIEHNAELWQDEVNSGRRKIVGFNCHVQEDPRAPELFTVDPMVERTAVERIREHRAKRDPKRFERAMADFRAAAVEFAGQECSEIGGGGLMPAAIEAAQADATTGEMMAVLKEALGWDAPYNFAPQ